MRIRLKDVCIKLIYILVFLSAMIYMVYVRRHSHLFFILYSMDMWVIAALCLLYLVIDFLSLKKLVVDRYILLLVIMLLHETAISWYQGYFTALGKIITDVFVWPLILIVFYCHTQKEELPDCFRPITILGMSGILIIGALDIMLHFQRTRGHGGALFISYYCFAFLPLIFYFGSKKTILLFSSAVTVLMLLSTKRTGFLIIAGGLCVYYFLQKMQSGADGRKLKQLAGYILVLAVIITAGMFIVDRLHLPIMERLSNSLDDGGSGRIEIWETVFKHFMSSPMWEKILGHGFHGVYYRIVIYNVRRYAHNSLLEILFDYGVLGLIYILMLMFTLVKKTVEMVRDRSPLAQIMGYNLVPLFMMSLVSYFYEQGLIIVPFSVIWGICLGEFKRSRNGIIHPCTGGIKQV